MIWRYLDSRMVEHVGTFDGYYDRGGTDVIYRFCDIDTGELSLVGGERLKLARALPGETRHSARAALAGRDMNSDEQRADRAERLARA